MTNNLNFEQLTAAVSTDEIDIVLVCMVDMFGRLVGKRFTSTRLTGNNLNMIGG